MNQPTTGLRPLESQSTRLRSIWHTIGKSLGEFGAMRTPDALGAGDPRGLILPTI